MAIKVTKQGQLPENIEYKGTCTHCRTEIECLQKDGTINYDQRDGDTLKVDCPVCSNAIYCSKKRS